MAKKYIEEISNGSVSEVETIEVKNKKGFLKKIGFKRFLIIIIFIIAVLGVYGTYHYYGKYKALNVNSSVEAEKETKRLVEVLGKLMELPQGEIPTIATISDKEKLNGQVFFAQAENGDILFAYTNAMKAILYRPSTNKIINVAPISINPSQEVTGAVKKGATTTDSKSR